MGVDDNGTSLYNQARGLAYKHQANLSVDLWSRTAHRAEEGGKPMAARAARLMAFYEALKVEYGETEAQGKLTDLIDDIAIQNVPELTVRQRMDVGRYLHAHREQIASGEVLQDMLRLDEIIPGSEYEL